MMIMDALGWYGGDDGDEDCDNNSVFSDLFQIQPMQPLTL